MDYPAITDIRGVSSYFLHDVKRYAKVNLKWKLTSLLRPENGSLSKLKALKNSKQNAEAIILANGPSLANLKASELNAMRKVKSLDVFGINYMVASDFFKDAGLDYYISSDPIFFDEKNARFEEIVGGINHGVRKGIFLPFSFSPHLLKIFEQKPFFVAGFNDMQGSSVFSNNIDPENPRSYASMTAYKALALALYMGYRKIYILGFDNSFFKGVHCDEENNLYRIGEHFDSKAYQTDGKRRPIFKGKRRMHQELIGNSRLFSDLYRFPGDRVINLDPDSLTDRFQKMKLAVWLEESK